MTKITTNLKSSKNAKLNPFTLIRKYMKYVCYRKNIAQQDSENNEKCIEIPALIYFILIIQQMNMIFISINFQDKTIKPWITIKILKELKKL